MSEIQEFCCMISNIKNSHIKTTRQQVFWLSIVLTVYSVLLRISVLPPSVVCNLICFDNQHLETVAGDLGNVKFDMFWQSAFGNSYRRHENSVTCPTPTGSKVEDYTVLHVKGIGHPHCPHWCLRQATVIVIYVNHMLANVKRSFRKVSVKMSCWPRNSGLESRKLKIILKWKRA